jgi:hypothetical protein
MTAEELKGRLAALGLTLDDKALQAALAGAQHLKAESERLARWLAEK